MMILQLIVLSLIILHFSLLGLLIEVRPSILEVILIHHVDITKLLMLDQIFYTGNAAASKKCHRVDPSS
jgi:hypothetical protein